MKKVFYLLMGLMILSSCEKDKGMDSIYPLEERAIIYDLSYGSDPMQKMDLFLPAHRTSSTKVVVFIHGGGWNKGDKTDFFNFPLVFADSGIATVAINYRLANASKGIDYHSILSDIDKAILFLQARDSIYNCSFDTHTLLGKSAGGHLALMYAYQKKSIVKVVAMAAPTDLSDMDLLNAGEMYFCVTNMIGVDDAYQRTLASPLNYTDSVATRLYHSKKDGLVPYHQSVAFYNKIKTLNPENSLVIFENSAHEILGEDLKQAMQETMDWVRQ
jgi:acetyl esterase/lipase